jgi:alkyl sulfatase BDS1-like metallo-beta-lactamase superfamily hydrolase
MNEGATLNDIIHTVTPPAHLVDRPYLQPVYDEPEFIVRNVWRLYGGWYDGNPSHLKPAPDAALAGEVAALAGGVGPLVTRAQELSEAGDHRLACHLVELAWHAAGDDGLVAAARAEIYRRRVADETSTMAKGIFNWAVNESAQRVESGANG